MSPISFHKRTAETPGRGFQPESVDSGQELLADPGLAIAREKGMEEIYLLLHSLQEIHPDCLEQSLLKLREPQREYMGKVREAFESLSPEMQGEVASYILLRFFGSKSSAQGKLVKDSIRASARARISSQDATTLEDIHARLLALGKNDGESFILNMEERYLKMPLEERLNINFVTARPEKPRLPLALQLQLAASLFRQALLSPQVNFSEPAGELLDGKLKAFGRALTQEPDLEQRQIYRRLPVKLLKPD